MSFPRIFLFLLLFPLFGFGCITPSSAPSETQDVVVIDDVSDEERDEKDTLAAGVYVLFALNIHDWAHEEESMATIARVLAIHEKNNVPITFYFTDPMFRMLYERHAELFARMRDSSVATFAYHLRPPSPYYLDFDWYGLDALSDDALYDLLYAYETHALDLTTGKYDADVPGGYAFMRDVLGYAPPSVGTLPVGRVGATLARVYRDLGATFAVRHGASSSLGDMHTSKALFYRPEDVDVKIYEHARDGLDGGDVLAAEVPEVVDVPYFLGIKYHENDFYLRGVTPWYRVYYENTENDKRQGGDEMMRTPPFAMDQALATSILQSPEEQEKDWELYESAVEYVAQHPETFSSPSLSELIKYL